MIYDTFVLYIVQKIEAYSAISPKYTTHTRAHTRTHTNVTY